MTRPKKM